MSQSLGGTHDKNLNLISGSLSYIRIYLISTIPPIIALTLLHALTSPSNPFRLPLFDVSAEILGGKDTPLIRWDAIHFAAIAERGYEYEQQLAFQPGWQGVLWLVGRCWKLVDEKTSAIEAMSRGGMILMILLAGWRGLALYDLTAQMFTKRIAYATWILYLLAPAPAVLTSLYTEPLFACLTFSGFGLAIRREYYLAGLLLAGATSIRATGILAAPTLAMMAIFRNGTSRMPITVFVWRALLVMPPCILIVAPFVLFQEYSFSSFCVPEPSVPWCSHRLPIAYSAVQAKYWNIGFLTYWKPANIPNFLQAAPVLAVSLVGLYRYCFSRTSIPNSAMPLIVQHAVMTFLLISQSHTQIALRVVTTDPVFWWLLTDIAHDKAGKGLTKAGRVWIWWTVIWGAVSIVLWAGHYPPA